jgi:pyruvate dehydrogenase E2 component (dihydrolipoamide acetyltransferase)
VVRKLAREMGVDLNEVNGTGPHGRVLREDVERYALGGRGGGGGRGGVEAAPAGGRIEIPGEGLPDFSQYGPVRREPLPQIRKTIARQMTRAWLNVPRVTHGDEADITELERNRKMYNESLGEGQAKLTVTAIVMKAVAHALRRFPQLNCSFDSTTEEVVWKDYIHVGVAVDTPRGLVVPVVRDVDKKPLPQVAKELNDVAERTRTGKFDIADLRGASFTVTNVGALGGTFSTPMVNFPETGILALAKSALMPRVVNQQIVARLIMPISLSFDHRMVDGADSARFCRDVIGSLENPLRLISM